MDLIGFSELRKTLLPDIQQLIQDAHDQLWADIPDPWYPKGDRDLPPKSSTELFEQFSAPNHTYPNLTNYQVAKQCVERAIKEKLYQEGADILFAVNRYAYWEDNLEEVESLLNKTQQIVDACQEVAVAPHLILRRCRWLRDRGDYQRAEELASLVLSQAANSLGQEAMVIGTWSFKNSGDFYGVIEAFLYLKGQIKMYLAEPVEAAIYATASCQLGQVSERLREKKVTIIPICLQMLTDIVLDMARFEREQLHSVVMVKNSGLTLMEYLFENSEILSSLPTEELHVLKPIKRSVRIELEKLTESTSRSGAENIHMPHILLHLLKSSIPENLEGGILKYRETEHDYATSVFNVYLAFKHFGHDMSRDILLLSMHLFFICYGGSTDKNLAYFQQELSKVRVTISNLLDSEETEVTGNPERTWHYPVLRDSSPMDLLCDFQNPAIPANDLKKSALAETNENVDTKNCPTTVDPAATTMARSGLLPSNRQKFKSKLFQSADVRPDATSAENSEDLVYRSLMNLPTMAIDGFDAPQQLLATSDKEDGNEAEVTEGEATTYAGEAVSGNTTPRKILQTNLTSDTVYQANVARYYSSEDQWRYQKTLVFMHDELQLTEQKKGMMRDAIKLQYLHQDSREVMYVGKRYRRKTSPETYHNDAIMHQLSMQCVTRFNKQIQHFPEYANRIRMVPVIYMEILDENDQILEVLNVEPFIHGNFTKMTNNLDIVNSKIDTQLLLAFSHFTWCDSDGKLMVTDLQGWMIPEDPKVAVILTDPAINSEHLKFLGITNMGKEGFEAFWTKQHPKCNEICQLLKLERDSEYNKNPERDDTSESDRNTEGEESARPTIQT